MRIFRMLSTSSIIFPCEDEGDEQHDEAYESRANWISSGPLSSIILAVALFDIVMVRYVVMMAERRSGCVCDLKNVVLGVRKF